MNMRLSEHADFDLLETTDIGGTNTQNSGGWLSMKNYGRAMAYVELGSWDSSDDLDQCRFQQATSSGGAGSKDLTTDGTGLNYDSSSPIDADGNFVIIEIRAEDLDVDNGYNYIRLYVAEGGNSGTDRVTGVVVRYDYAYPQKELQGAAASGSRVYVDVHT